MATRLAADHAYMDALRWTLEHRWKTIAGGGVALLLTAFALVFRKWILKAYAHRVGTLSEAATFRYTVLTGAILGVLVASTSVGAGALGVTVRLAQPQPDFLMLVSNPFNVIISNVPGPQFPLYTNGARMEGIYPISAIVDGVGLNMTLMSYNGSLDFGLVADREMVPDIWMLMDFLRDELETLEKLAKKQT